MNTHIARLPRLTPPLRGRHNQIQTLRGQLDAVQAGQGGIVLITGLAGMGKSALLAEAEAMAHESGIRVFRGAADTATQVVPVSPLLDALVSTEDPPVDVAVLRNLSQFPDQRFWLLREMQESLERAAMCGPIMISIDDVHWADPATLVALGTLPRRLATHRVLWLLTARTGKPAMTPGALNSLETIDTLRITLDPLDEAAVADVAEDLLGGRPDPGLVKVLRGVCGQPFLLTELIRGLRDEKLVDVDNGTARLTGIPMPLRFLESVDRHLGRLSASARDALQVACVLGRQFSADELSALTNTSPAAILVAVQEMLAAGLVTEIEDRLVFRHELVREAVDASLPRTVRQSLRQRAVAVMLHHGAPPSDVAELVMDVARPGDTPAIAILRRAAAETGRVSPTVASALSRRALDLAPPGASICGQLTAETIAYLVHAGKAAEAVKLMTVAAGNLSDPAVEAEARLSLAILLMQYSPADVVEQCRQALKLHSLPAALQTQLLSLLSCGLDLFGDVSAAERPVMDAVSVARASGDQANEVVTLVPRAVQALGYGNWRQAIDFVNEAIARQHTAESPAVRLWLPEAWKAMIYTVISRTDESLALIDAGMEAAQRDGISANIRIWSMLRCRTLFCAGQLTDARTEAEATIEMADEIGDGSYGYINHVSLYILGRVALHTGDPVGLAQARQSAERLCQAEEPPSSQRLGAWLTALVAYADGDAALAAQSGTQVLDLLASGPLSPTSPQMYAESAMLTRILLEAGKEADAKLVVGRLESFAALHADFPFLMNAALHARAVLDGDPEPAMQAVALSGTDPRPLVRAAVLEDAGRLIPRRRTAKAVPFLEKALALYVAAGAERDAARVRSLLRARGIRPGVDGPRSAPEWPELTESEFAVVSLVAHGCTNREIAERLYLSPYTVNAHLRHVFSKLGIRSRVELARLAAARGLAAERS
ncbi:MAG TPA: AAA family ATPase [Streptosporangiaceae bacterium]